MTRLREILSKILPWLVQITGAQLQARLNPHLRASLFGGCILSIGLALYLGWISGETAGLLWTNVVTLFNLDVVKKAPGLPNAVSIQQVPTVVHLPSVEAANKTLDNKSVLQDRISINVPVTSAITPPEPKWDIPLGPEFDLKEHP